MFSELLDNIVAILVRKRGKPVNALSLALTLYEKLHLNIKKMISIFYLNAHIFNSL